MAVDGAGAVVEPSLALGVGDVMGPPGNVGPPGCPVTLADDAAVGVADGVVDGLVVGDEVARGLCVGDGWAAGTATGRPTAAAARAAM